MRQVQFILRRGEEAEVITASAGTTAPGIGDVYNIHFRRAKEPSLWRVSEVHRELWPGPMEISGARPLSVVDPSEYHEGETVVVVLDPFLGTSAPKVG